MKIRIDNTEVEAESGSDGSGCGQQGSDRDPYPLPY